MEWNNNQLVLFVEPMIAGWFSGHIGASEGGCLPRRDPLNESLIRRWTICLILWHPLIYSWYNGLENGLFMVDVATNNGDLSTNKWHLWHLWPEMLWEFDRWRTWRDTEKLWKTGMGQHGYNFTFGYIWDDRSADILMHALFNGFVWQWCMTSHDIPWHPNLRPFEVEQSWFTQVCNCLNMVETCYNQYNKSSIMDGFMVGCLLDGYNP